MVVPLMRAIVPLTATTGTVAVTVVATPSSVEAVTFMVAFRFATVEGIGVFIAQRPATASA